MIYILAGPNQMFFTFIFQFQGQIRRQPFSVIRIYFVRRTSNLTQRTMKIHLNVLLLKFDLNPFYNSSSIQIKKNKHPILLRLLLRNPLTDRL